MLIVRNWVVGCQASSGWKANLRDTEQFDTFYVIIYGRHMMSEQDRNPADHRGIVRRVAFRVAVAITSLFLLLALSSTYKLIFTNWLPSDLLLNFASSAKTEADSVHRLHSLALGLIAWFMLLGVVLQFHRPERKVAPLLASFAVPAAIAASEALAGMFTIEGTAPFFVAILAVIALHPAVKTMLQLPRWHLPMLGLVLAASVPWALYAVQTGQAAREVKAAYDVSHLTFVSSLALLIVVWGIIGATTHKGWKYSAAASVIATACFGLQSLIFPGVLSGLSAPLAAAALVWCIIYASAAFLRKRAVSHR